MKGFRRVLPLGLAGILCAAAPVQAMVGSPAFSRTAEEWARLQDDVIEYDELADLIHEYNATVQKNQIDLNEFQKEYGTSRDDVSDRYRELADELESDLSYPDSGDSDYASRMGVIISNETQIKNYRELADDNVEDLAIKRMTYDSAEAVLVSTAQTHMINYYLYQLQLQADQKKLELLQENLQSAQKKKEVGMTTDVDVLNAQENVRNGEQAVQSDETSIDNVHQRLIVLLGWKHDASPEIRELPALDVAKIDAMNPAEDKAAALENNYTLKVNKRKYENATSEDTKESLEKSIRDNEQNIGANLSAEYQNVLSLKTAYDLAAAQASLDARDFETAKRQYELGNISRLDYVTSQNTAETSALNQQMAALKLFQAIQTYEWAVNGLASASAM